ncbi:5-oxoprolinase subunit C family protein [Cyclobacterium marinum]|uniref:Allophanate hydrolase subunit 2 n=1 Tax=Cyclobacterium marinum (strain ATCC 25205 / DSM 745 / LMG 13164 / NCIMB 1802) TaxID=880070 RepID=G0IXS2_CYCMS|nr:biotin-dependent carboxyltransferase family protein [Cyclobacterium marinum]AEL28069.1 Allophanate hydrolase subunit 2 [Cyclobacterium marinum DSM 745]MBI0397839.1 biotin-dependent carboxyltransferase family protein [Cyclobacterium marinum]|tara:strand:+ start:33150 stop:34019 length:870 start_codon:yes stop_codon:yes gene_type:complete
MGKIVFIKAGLFTTIQDQGRFGFVDKGIPTSGPMDESSFHLANLLVRKKPGAACLEIYMGNVSLYFTENCQIVCTGADAKIQVDSKLYGTNEIINISAYSKVNIASFRQGQWLYLAINGLFESESIMGSQSFYQEVTPLAKFKDNDILTFASSPNHIPTDFSKIKPRGFPKSPQIPVFPGPSFSCLSKTQQHALTDSCLTLSPIQNRMGIQLVEKIKHTLPELISSPVYPGTVQLTQAGKIIILMKDAQVTGGYPRVLQLTSIGISRLSQLRPQAKFKFHFVPQKDISI